MSEQKPNPNSDELDLGQLFKIIGDFFNKIFLVFLKFLLLIKKNIIILLVLGLAGVIGGYFLGKLSETKLKNEVIVSPSLDAKDYLYDVVQEIQSKVETKDSAFFKSIGISMSSLKDFKVEITPLNGDTNKGPDEELLNILKEYKEESFVRRAIENEVRNFSPVMHRISFYFENQALFVPNIPKLLDYINSSEYYNKILKQKNINLNERIGKNEYQIVQIDSLIKNYSKSLLEKQTLGANTMLYNKENSLNVTELMNMRNGLIKDNESIHMQLLNNTHPIRIINIGKTQRNEKSLYNGMILKLPLFLFGLYFVILISLYLDKKSEEVRA
ncbi:MAG: hypothetical protein OIF50_07595 [Flavobacteriaceae bacterium]|nr:hypothetical protein [Flavobacteriaceae bacterium]